jgi:hypothetical protein
VYRLRAAAVRGKLVRLFTVFVSSIEARQNDIDFVWQSNDHCLARRDIFRCRFREMRSFRRLCSNLLFMFFQY